MKICFFLLLFHTKFLGDFGDGSKVMMHRDSRFIKIMENCHGESHTIPKQMPNQIKIKEADEQYIKTLMYI
jgi:hypothetical protein